jgi:hypothetical protein
VPAVTFGVSTNFALANCLASRSFGNVSVALASPRFPRCNSNETYHVPWDLLAIRPSHGAMPSARTIGSSNSRDHFGALMAPAFFIEFDTRAGRRPRGIIQVARVAASARHPGGTAAAGVVAIPRLPWVVFAHPASVLAKAASHGAFGSRRTGPQRQRGVKNPIARANSMNPPKAQTAMFIGLIIVVLFFYGTSAAIFGPMIVLS